MRNEQDFPVVAMDVVSGGRPLFLLFDFVALLTWLQYTSWNIMATIPDTLRQLRSKWLPVARMQTCSAGRPIMLLVLHNRAEWDAPASLE